MQNVRATVTSQRLKGNISECKTARMVWNSGWHVRSFGTKIWAPETGWNSRPAAQQGSASLESAALRVWACVWVCACVWGRGRVCLLALAERPSGQEQMLHPHTQTPPERVRLSLLLLLSCLSAHSWPRQCRTYTLTERHSIIIIVLFCSIIVTNISLSVRTLLLECVATSSLMLLS